MNEYIRQLIERFRELWGRLTPIQKGLATGVPVLLFVLLALMLAAISRPPESYGVLFADLAREDAAVITGKLKAAGVPYKLKDDGVTVEVPLKDVYDLRLQLASQGLPKGPGVGFEIFDKTQVLGTTEAQQKVNYLRALQGELTRTIMAIAEVRTARVNLALPQETLYSDTAKSPTASVLVEVKRGYRLEAEQVRGIVHLIASSVEGLKPTAVKVIDNHGNVLSDVVRDDLMDEAGEGGTPGLSRQAKLTQGQMKVQSGIEKAMEGRITEILDKVLGDGRAAVKVTAEVNFDQIKSTVKTFEPVVGNEGIVRSSQKKNESYTGVGGIPGGVPGVESNIPGYQAVVGGNLAYNKNEDTKNYEVNEKLEEVIKAPGSIRRLNVAVFVDNVQPQQHASIQRVVSAAAGIDTTRGDVVIVENTPFDKTAQAAMADERAKGERMQQEQMWLDVAKYAAAAAVAILVLIFMRALIRPRVVRETMVVEVAGEPAGPEPVEEAPPPPPPPPPPTMDEVAPPPPLLIEPEPTAALERQRRQQIRQHVNRLARSKPDMIAQIIKRWLNEDKR